MMLTNTSPLLFPGPMSSVAALSIVHFKRDLQIPTILKEYDEDDEGYTEGKVVNKRFGTFATHRLNWSSMWESSSSFEG